MTRKFWRENRENRGHLNAIPLSQRKEDILYDAAVVSRRKPQDNSCANKGLQNPRCPVCAFWVHCGFAHKPPVDCDLFLDAPDFAFRVGFFPAKQMQKQINTITMRNFHIFENSGRFDSLTIGDKTTAMLPHQNLLEIKW